VLAVRASPLFRRPKFNNKKMYNTKEELFIAINKSLPYPDQISDLDFSTEKDVIRLTWRKTNKFRISTNGHVEKVGNSVLIGSDISIMFRELIKHQYMSGLS
jgi:hypothetical protein